MSTLPIISHREIIERAGGPAAFGRAIGVVKNTTKAWSRQDSIPADYWWVIASKHIASLEELALARAHKASVKLRSRRAA